MLQQTQVDRVRPYYEAWFKRFPTVTALASAPLADVLVLWQGLGYNRRAKMLHEATKEIVSKYKAIFPKTAEELERLRGVGPYTARAVAAFSYNADGVFIETNIRTAVTHHFFPKKKKVADAEIFSVLQKAHPKGKAREWYAALMDYGAHLKRSGVRINAKSKTYAKQSAFRGSDREARGAILKALAKGSETERYLIGVFGPDRALQVRAQLQKMLQEGMVSQYRGKYRLPS